MLVRVAINGFGRIGRNILRAIFESARDDIIVVGINDLGPVETNAHLLRYDSVHGKFPADVKVSGNNLDVGQGPIKVTSIRDPRDLPWKELDVDIALECTGIFASREKASMHLDAGAKRVLVSAPASGVDLTVVYGVNHKKIEAIIHPESLIHSFVEFVDGTILASMAEPDMKIPISYGLSYPKTLKNGLRKINLNRLSELTFKKIDRIKFPSIDFAYFAIETGKGMPIFLNAANEVAVNHFLKENIKFLDIYRLISEVLNYADKNNIKLNSVTLDTIQDFNEEAIKISKHLSQKLI